MPSFVDVTNGNNADASTIQQVVDALKGTAGKGIPLSPTAINDAINFAVAIKNNDAGASKALIVYKADGTVLFQVDKNGVVASPDGTLGASQIATLTGAQTLTNKTLGTGSVVPGSLLTAGTVTSDKLSLTEVNGLLSADTLVTAGSGISLATISLTAGTWELWGQAALANAAAGNSLCSLYARDDTGSVLIPASAGHGTVAPSTTGFLSFSTKYAPAGTVTVSLRCFASTNNVTAKQLDTNVSLATTYIRALRIG